jgi:hypothetical protein
MVTNKKGIELEREGEEVVPSLFLCSVITTNVRFFKNLNLNLIGMSMHAMVPNNCNLFIYLFIYCSCFTRLPLLLFFPTFLFTYIHHAPLLFPCCPKINMNIKQEIKINIRSILKIQCKQKFPIKNMVFNLSNMTLYKIIVFVSMRGSWFGSLHQRPFLLYFFCSC